ncbi:MAG: CotH kinase family protein [Bacteroidia bacterium]
MKNRLFSFSLLIVVIILSSCSENKSGISAFYLETDISKLNTEKKIPCRVSYSDSVGERVFDKMQAGIMYKGNQSLAFEKKSFSIELSEKVKIEGMDADDDWKLNASYIDKTFLRNKISYNLYRLFSENNIAPNVSWVEVFLNNTYHGLYIVTDRMDAKRLGLDDKDTAAVLFKAAPISQLPSALDSVQRGYADYVMTAERWSSWSEEGKKEFAADIYFNQRYPEFAKKNKHFVIYQLTAFLHNTTTEEFTAKRGGVDSVFDIENIIDFHLLLLITNNGDGVVNNNYLYRQNSNTPYRICPYDFDHSFGRDGDGEPNPADFIDLRRNILITRLIETNAFNYKERLKEKYLRLKDRNILTVENITAMIDEHAARIKPFALKDERKWKPEAHKYFQNTDYDKEIELMKVWLKQHLPKVEKYINEL